MDIQPRDKTVCELPEASIIIGQEIFRIPDISEAALVELMKESMDQKARMIIYHTRKKISPMTRPFTFAEKDEVTEKKKKPSPSNNVRKNL